MDGNNLGKLRIMPDRTLYLEWFVFQMIYRHRMGLRPISLLVR